MKSFPDFLFPLITTTALGNSILASNVIKQRIWSVKEKDLEDFLTSNSCVMGTIQFNVYKLIWSKGVNH